MEIKKNETMNVVAYAHMEWAAPIVFDPKEGWPIMVLGRLANSEQCDHTVLLSGLEDELVYQIPR